MPELCDRDGFIMPGNTKKNDRDLPGMKPTIAQRAQEMAAVNCPDFFSFIKDQANMMKEKKKSVDC